MNNHRKTRAKGIWAVLVAAALAATVLAASMVTGAATLAQGPAEGSWSRGFVEPGGTRGLASQSNTKVSGGALKLAESPASDLGEAVPGENAVYSSVAVGDDVYLGTGNKGHLVHFDKDKVYQEGYQGPTHSGVSSSLGQTVPTTETRVTALTYDGSRYLYGGTGPNGHVFSYDITAPGKRPHDEGVPGSPDPVLSLACAGGLVYAGTESGHVYTYSGGEEGTFTDLGTASGDNAVNAVAVVGGTIYVGTGNGRLLKYDGGFTDLGTPDIQINALAASGSLLYIGCESGKVYSYDTTSPGSFTSLDTAPDAVKAIAVLTGAVYAGAANGHVYLCDGSAPDQGHPANSGAKPVNCLSVASNASNVLYGGTGADETGSTGRLFRLSTGVYEDFDQPTAANNDDVTSVAYDAKTLYLARGANLYSFQGPEGQGQPYKDYGTPGDTINDIDAKTGTVYLGLQNGHLYSYNSSEHADAFHDEGVPTVPSPVTSVVIRTVGDNPVVYVGLENGDLMNGADMGGSALAHVGSAIKDMCYKEGGTGAPAGLYIAGGNGHLYLWDGSSLLDKDEAGTDATSANAVAVYGNDLYVGHEDGSVYKFDGTTLSSRATGLPAIKSMAPGSQGVLCGMADGHLYCVYDQGSPFDEGLVPNGQSVNALCHTGSSVWLGTAKGYLSSHDDAHLGDLGEQIKRQIMLWCMTYDPVRHVFYAGTYVNAHFLVIDPATNTVTDLGRPIAGERAIIDIVVTQAGLVVGSTYGGTEERHNPDGGHLFSYDPTAREFKDRGRAPAPDNNWWISGLVEGAGLLYATTACSANDEQHPAGTLFSVDTTDPASWVKTDIPVTVPDKGTNTLVRKENDLFGATCMPSPKFTSQVYKFDTLTSTLTVLGDGPGTDIPVNRLQVDGDKAFGSQDDGNVFWFNRTGAYDPVSLGKPVPGCESVYPLVTGADDALLCGVTGGGDGSGHMSSYDPVLNTFRDIDMSPVSQQDRVASSAFDAAPPPDPFAGVTFGGTRGAWMPGHVDRYAAKLFRVDPYCTNPGSALSTVIDPSMIELQAIPDASDAIEAVCPAPGQANRLYVGTAGADGHGYIYLYDVMTEQFFPGSRLDSGEQRVLSMCAGPDGKVYVGTGTDGGDVKIKRFSPGGSLQDCGTATGYSSIRSAAVGPDGNIYFGSGESPSDSPELFRCEPATGAVTPIATTLTTGNRIDSLVTSGSKVYGVAGSPPGGTSSVEFFSYDPSSGQFHNMGTRPEYTGEWTAGGLVAAPDGKLYFATGLAGKLIRYDPVADSFTAVHEWLPSDPAEVTALAATGSNASNVMLYGCAGSTGRLFKFNPQGAVFTDLGPLTVHDTGVRAATTDALGNPYFGTSGDTKLIRYDVNRAFQWDQLTFDKTVPPPSTEAHMDICNEAGAVLQSDVTSPADIVGTAPVRLQARLKTTDPAETPAFTSWEVTWKKKASVDTLAYPYQNPPGGGAYPGDSLWIWGGDFGASAGSVTIGGHPVPPESVSWHPNAIQVTVPGGAEPGDTLVVAPAVGEAEPSDATAVNILAVPHVVSASPSSARLGDVVEVHGSGFLASRSSGDGVLFNGLSATEYTQWSDTVIKAKVPPLAATGSLSVTVNQHVSTAIHFTVIGGGGPTVTITAPTEGANVTGNVAVRATVQREGGTTPVELWVDGAKKASDPAAPYTFTWNADSVTDGAHTLTVKATDGYDRQGSKSVTVYVDHTVPSRSQTWYFAEGCTDYGFETWVLIGNPSSEIAQARVTFMDDKGATFVRSFALAPNSRTTVNAADVAPGANVSVKVEADRQVVCERSMYWGNREEGHTTVGTTSLSRTWYFAEGSTDYGFETFVLLGNPGGSKVKATVHYLFPDGTSAAREHDIAPHSRVTVNAAADVGARDFSVKIDAGDPGIVAERSMYHGNRRCGTGTIGAKQPSLTWFLSEGSTDWGFETWLLIQRPGAGDARVTASYRKASGETVERVYTVKGNSRYTVDLSREVGTADVSTQVTSNVGVVCERSMYWNGRAAGHTTIGSPGPGRTWYLAEGCSDYGFETWVLLDNPSGATVNATLTFMKEDGTTVPAVIGLKPHSRMSVNAATYVGAASFSTKVSAATPIMVERSVYWNNRSGGTGSIGAR